MSFGSGEDIYNIIQLYISFIITLILILNKILCKVKLIYLAFYKKVRLRYIIFSFIELPVPLTYEDSWNQSGIYKLEQNFSYSHLNF